MNKSHKAILLLGQRAWSKIFKANREETAGSRAAGSLRGIVAWPWQSRVEHWHLDDNRRPINEMLVTWATLPIIEGDKLQSLMPVLAQGAKRRRRQPGWGPGPRPWIGKPGGTTLGSGMLERFVDELHETETS